jgi:hypothetical protein
MSKKGLFRNEYIARFFLYRTQPWLRIHESALKELYKLCDDKLEIALITDLLKRFEYLTMVKIKHHLTMLIEHMKNVWELPVEHTQIVATAFDYDPDSSHHILQMMKPILASCNWEPKLVTQLGSSIKLLPQFPNVVLVDEFMGSGKTIKSRVKSIKNEYERVVSQNKVNGYTIKTCVLASMEEALKLLEEEKIEAFASLVLKKGISDNYEPERVKEEIKRMLRMESLLLPECNNIQLPTLGYDETESLYSMELGNTPNSVFPIFWWRCLANRKMRKTILSRYERKSERKTK